MPKTPSLDLTVITPMYNEAAQIQKNIAKIIGVLSDMDVTWEYILVNDGSLDNSLELAEQATADCEHCRIIHYPRNRGRGYALRQGFEAAEGSYIITTESDLSWGESIIPQLYAAITQGDADVVIASVNLPGGKLTNVPAHRVALSKVGNQVLRWTMGGELTMLSGMTRAYTRQVIDSLYLEEDEKEIHVEIVAKAAALGYKFKEIPAEINWAREEVEDAAPKKKKRGSSRIFRAIVPHLVAAFQHGSLKVLFTFCVISGVLGVLAVTLGVFNKIFHILPYQMPYLLTYGLLLFIMAIFFGLFGLLSIQMKFIYKSIVHMQSQIKRQEIK